MTAHRKFDRVALIGLGLINSSLAHALKKLQLASEIIGCARTQKTLDTASSIGLVDRTELDPVAAVRGANLVVLGSPVGSFSAIAEQIGAHLEPGTIVTDVGSVKTAAIEAIAPHLPEEVHLVPAHPVAGTEHSGPESGFADLFKGRWCILTPPPGTDQQAIEQVSKMWHLTGMTVELMDPIRHDLILAITSHLPHLIAFNIVGTVADLEDETQTEVIKYAAGGFRDFTRIASSDPIMWRDIFLNNQPAVLEMLGRFTEDLAALQRAIRRSDGDYLEELFRRTRTIRRSVIEAQQA